MSASADKKPAAQHLLTSSQLSARAGYPTEWTLARWRRENIGPPWVRHIGRIYYDLEQIEAWEKSQTTQPSDYPPAPTRSPAAQPAQTPATSRKRDAAKREQKPVHMGDLFD